MVWEQGSVVIVNLTRLTEEGVAMCHRYWPEEGSDLYHIYEVGLVAVLLPAYLLKGYVYPMLKKTSKAILHHFAWLSASY